MPHITELMKQEWLLNKDNGLIFLVHPLLQVNANFAAYSPTREEVIAGRKLSPVLPEPVLSSDAVEVATTTGAIDLSQLQGDPVAVSIGFTERELAIRKAVAAVLPENYGSPAGGRPAMPKVADIKAATGLNNVTAVEVLAALPITAEGE